MDVDLKRAVLAKALALIAGRELPRAALAEKLMIAVIDKVAGSGSDERYDRHSGIQVIEQVLDELVECGYVNDQRFGTLYAEHKAEAGFGPIRIEAELRRKGVDADTVMHVIDSLETDWRACAAALLRKKLKGTAVPDLKTRQKSIRYLLSRGFPLETALSVIRHSDASGADEACD